MDTNDTLLGHLHFESEIVRWERDLRAAAIPHVFLKGIGFDRWLDRSATRVSRDIDILSPRSARRPFARLLKERGYRCVITEPNASTWLGPENRIPIDLHDTLKGATASADSVWRVVERTLDHVDVAGLAIPVLGSPAREMVAGLHLAIAGVDDNRASADLTAAATRSPAETWQAADALARELGCRVLFEAGFAATPGLREFATSIGFSMTGAEEILADREGRKDAIGFLPALQADSLVERARLGSRFLRLHFARLDLGAPSPPSDTLPHTRSFTETLVLSAKSAGALAHRSLTAVVAARRLDRVLRARERDVSP